MTFDVRTLSDRELVDFIDDLVQNNESEFKITIASKEAHRRGILNRCRVDTSHLLV
jgi:hypothetical protein